jgi:hypothetical protein
MKELYEIDKDTLKKLREALPFGGLKLLGERAKYSTVYLNRFFKGDTKISTENERIIKEAQKIIREFSDNSERMKAEIMDCLKRNSKPEKLY